MSNERVVVQIKTSEGNHVDYYDGKKAVDNLGAGDTYYIPKFVKSPDEVFAKLIQEVNFQQMYNFTKNQLEPIPRLIAAQTEKGDEREPIYRMPGCNERNIPTEAFTSTIKEIMEQASHQISTKKKPQTLNHCVVTLYRDKNDSLAFHQDKVIDLADDSLILSVSFGSPRPIIFQEINGKKQQSILLQPGSLLAFGAKTNKMFRHRIPKVEEDVGPRVSLSLRTIETFVDGDDKILGKGEEHQCKNYPFIKSYDDESEYTDEIKQEIAGHVQTSINYLENLRSSLNNNQE